MFLILIINALCLLFLGECLLPTNIQKLRRFIVDEILAGTTGEPGPYMGPERNNYTILISATNHTGWEAIGCSTILLDRPALPKLANHCPPQFISFGKCSYMCTKTGGALSPAVDRVASCPQLYCSSWSPLYTGGCVTRFYTQPKNGPEIASNAMRLLAAVSKKYLQ